MTRTQQQKESAVNHFEEINLQYFKTHEIQAEKPYFGGRSLEGRIECGDDLESRKQPVVLNNCPVLLYEVVLDSKCNHSKRKTVADAGRYLTYAGIEILENFILIEKLNAIRKHAFRRRNESMLETFSDQRFEPLRDVSHSFTKFKCHLFKPVAVRATELHHDTGLPEPTVVTLALMAGIAQSTDLVLPTYKEIAVNGLRSFADHLGERHLDYQSWGLGWGP